jgi:hypothetical protein
MHCNCHRASKILPVLSIPNLTRQRKLSRQTLPLLAFIFQICGASAERPNVAVSSASCDGPVLCEFVAHISATTSGTAGSKLEVAVYDGSDTVGKPVTHLVFMLMALLTVPRLLSK